VLAYRLCLGFLLLFELTTAPKASATAVADASLQLVSFTIATSSGVVVFSPSAMVYGQADQATSHFFIRNTCTASGVFASCSAATAVSSATGWADSSSRSAYASSVVDVTNGSGGAAFVSQLRAPYFSIMGTQGPTTVQFSATLISTQSLMTDADGRSAFS